MQRSCYVYFGVGVILQSLLGLFALTLRSQSTTTVQLATSREARTDAHSDAMVDYHRVLRTLVAEERNHSITLHNNNRVDDTVVVLSSQPKGHLAVPVAKRTTLPLNPPPSSPPPTPPPITRPPRPPPVTPPPHPSTRRRKLKRRADQGSFDQGADWEVGWDTPLAEMPFHQATKPVVPPEALAVQSTYPPSFTTPMEQALQDCGGNRLDADFDCLLRKFDVHSGKQECDDMFGYSSITAYRRSHRAMCEATVPGRVEASQGSEVLCYHVRPRDHPQDNSVCYGHNVAVHYGLMRDGGYPWLSFQKGALTVGGCEVPTGSRNAWRGMFIQCLADWMNLGFKVEPTLKCDVWVNHTVYFVTRAGDYSPFAATHDFLNVLYPLALLRRNLRDVGVVVMDRMPKGFYLPVWQYLYSPRVDLEFLPDMRERYSGKSVCYKEAIFNVPARLSPLYDNRPECVYGGTGSAIMRTYAEFLTHGLHAGRTRSVPDRLVVTVVDRKNYKTGHEIGRQLGNRDEMLHVIRSISLPGGHSVVANAVDFGTVDFDQQINISRSSDVLLGLHGAGLIHLMFLHPHAGVVEIFCPEKPASNYRYNRLAARMGIYYESLETRSPRNVVAPDALRSKLQVILPRVWEKKQKRPESAVGA